MPCAAHTPGHGAKVPQKAGLLIAGRLYALVEIRPVVGQAVALFAEFLCCVPVLCRTDGGDHHQGGDRSGEKPETRDFRNMHCSYPANFRKEERSLRGPIAAVCAVGNSRARVLPIRRKPGAYWCMWKIRQMHRIRGDEIHLALSERGLRCAGVNASAASRRELPLPFSPCPYQALAGNIPKVAE